MNTYYLFQWINCEKKKMVDFGRLFFVVKIYLNGVLCQQVQVIFFQEIHIWIPPGVLPNNVDVIKRDAIGNSVQIT